VRCLAMGFLLSKARLDGQIDIAALSAPRGPLHKASKYEMDSARAEDWKGAL
jgi:hypothetical protein